MATFYHCERCHHDLSDWIVHQVGPCVCPFCHMPLDPGQVRKAFWEERSRALIILFGFLLVPGGIAALFYESFVPLIIGGAVSGLIVGGIAFYLYRSTPPVATQEITPTYRVRYTLLFFGIVLLLALLAYPIALYSRATLAIFYGVGGLVLLVLSAQTKRWNADGRLDAPGVLMLSIGLGLLVYPAYFGVIEWPRQHKDRILLEEGLAKMFHRSPDRLELSGNRLSEFQGIAQYGEHSYRIRVIVEARDQYKLIAEPINNAPFPPTNK